jgi:hypothetical protein
MPRLSITGIPVLCGPGAGPMVRWFSATNTIQQGCPSSCLLYMQDVASGRNWTVDPQGANWLAAGDSTWAARLQGDGYRDSNSHRNPDWMPLEVDAYLGLVLISNYTNGQGLWTLAPNGTVTRIASAVLDVQQGDIHKGVAIYRAGGQLHRYPDNDIFPAWGQCSDARYADGYLCYNGNLGLCWALWAQPTRGLVLSSDGHDFNPDVGALASGLVRVVSSRTAGEGPGDLRTYDINPVTGAVNGILQPWVDLTQPAIRVPTFRPTDRKIGLGLFDEPLPAPQIAGDGDPVMAETRAQWRQVPFVPFPTVYPLMALKDGPTYKPAECPAGCLPFIESYPIPYQESPVQCAARIQGIVEAMIAAGHHELVLDPCVFLGWNGSVYVRDEQIVIDTLWELWELTLKFPQIVAWWGFTYDRGHGIDGLIRWPNIQEAWRRLRAASADWRHFPTNPIPPDPPHKDTKMTTCAVQTLVSKTLWVAEMNDPVIVWDARTTDLHGPWQTIDWIGWDFDPVTKRAVTAVIRCHGTSKYMAIDPVPIGHDQQGPIYRPIAVENKPQVFRVTQDGPNVDFYATGYGHIVVEQGPTDKDAKPYPYPMTIRAANEGPSAWTWCVGINQQTGQVIPEPF